MKKTYKILTFLLPIQIIIVTILSKYPQWIETYYSNGFYTYYATFLRFLFWKIPFSIGDIAYILLAFYIVRSLWKSIVNKQFSLYKIFSFLSVIYLLFYLNWGLNYYREPIHKRLHFSNDNYTMSELVQFTENLIEKTNSIHISLTNNDTLVVKNTMTDEELIKNSKIAYNQVFKKHPQLKCTYLSSKNSLFSISLSYAGFSGYLNPFTGEAQINSKAPPNSKPFTSCHEIAHQMGIAFEDEANFMAYITTIKSSNLYYQYSGYTSALSYCLRNLSKNNYQNYQNLIKKINSGILKDWQKRRKHWEMYANESQKHLSKAQDVFLKLNKQEEGIKSYGKMIKLILNYK